MQVLTQLGHVHWSSHSKAAGLDSAVPGHLGSSSRDVGSTLVQGPKEGTLCFWRRKSMC